MNSVMNKGVSMSFKRFASTIIIFQLSGFAFAFAQEQQNNTTVTNKLASLSVSIEQNNELFKLYPAPGLSKYENKGTAFLELPKKLSYISLCNKKENLTEKDCIVINKLKFSNTKTSFSVDWSSVDAAGKPITYKRPAYEVQVSNLPENFKSIENYDIKQLILEGLKKGMSVDSMYLRISPIELVEIKKYRTSTNYLTFSEKSVEQSEDSKDLTKNLNLVYKTMTEKIKFIDLFTTPIHQNISITDGLSMKLAFTGFDLKYQLFNPPLMSFQNKIREQLFDEDNNTLQSYLTFTVAFNLTRLHPAWTSVSEMLEIEKEKQMRQDFSKNANVISLKQDLIYQNVLKESRSGLVTKYIIQSAEMKLEIADYERTNNLVNTSDASKVAMDQNIKIPSSRQVYGNGQLNYQEKYNRYMYYSKMTNDTLNILSGAASAGQSWLDSYLR